MLQPQDTNKMTTSLDRKSRDFKGIKAVNASQRSACAMVVYRYKTPEIISTTTTKASSESLFSGGASDSSSNLEVVETPLIIDNDIVRCNIDKNKSSVSGSFSVTLKRGAQERGETVHTNKTLDYLKLINPGDWVMLYIRKDKNINPNSADSKSGLKMIGIVENIRFVEADSKEDSFPRFEYIITGRDIGKVFDMSIFYNPLMNDATLQQVLGTNVLNDITEALKGKNLTPDAVIKQTLSFLFGGKLQDTSRTNQNWYIPKNMAKLFGASDSKSEGVSVIDILDTSRIGLLKYINNKAFSYPLLGTTAFTQLPSQGTAWGLLQYLSNPLLNEMFVELSIESGKLKPAFTLRQYPFSSQPNHNNSLYNVISNKNEADLGKALNKLEQTFFTELPKVTIKSTSILEKNIGKSDFERINHIVVTPRVLDNITANILYTSILNIPSIQRYGLKTIQSQNSYVLNPEASEVCERSTVLIADWFFLAHTYYNGTIVTEGMDSFVEIGSNLHIDDINTLFHIEGYNHLYQQEASTGRIVYETTFRVSRGQWFNGQRTDFLDKHSSFQEEVSTVATTIIENSRNKR